MNGGMERPAIEERKRDQQDGQVREHWSFEGGNSEQNGSSSFDSPQAPRREDEVESTGRGEDVNGGMMHGEAGGRRQRALIGTARRAG